jgi:hypothetical protein
MAEALRRTALIKLDFFSADYADYADFLGGSVLRAIAGR